MLPIRTWVIYVFDKKGNKIKKALTFNLKKKDDVWQLWLYDIEKDK